jgi:deazaflavin-dependent oxidoreductase (nitroreductase family)
VGDPDDRRSSPSLEEDLTAWGRTIALETRGRQSGHARRATVGFVTEPDGSLLVAARSETTHWARNLTTDPRCVVERAGTRRECQAIPLAGADAQAAVTGLILKYGTPAERLGSGPAFRLVLVTPARADARPPGARR